MLLAFRAEVELRRDSQKGWYFHFRTKPLKDSAIARILGQLLASQ